MTSKVKKVSQQLLLLATAATVAAVCAGCSGATSSSSGDDSAMTDNGGVTVTVTPALCDQLAAVPANPSTPSIAVVVDRTRSGQARGLPPAAADALRRAQTSGWNLTVVSVNGAGAKPIIGKTITLDPKPGIQSPNADRARAGALACLPTWLDDPALTPTSPGSDVLEAIAAAGRQQPKALLIISDGVSTAGSLNISQIGYDADVDTTVQQLTAMNALPDLHSVPTTLWTDLGETATPLPEPARAGLKSLWTATLKAAGSTVTFDTRVTAATPPDTLRSSTIADPVPTIKATTVQAGDATCVNLPSSLLFAPDDASIIDTTPLAPIAAALASHAQWTARIVGHTADFGPRDGQLSLSLQRARAAQNALRTLGASSNPISVVGVGSDDPYVVEWHDGVHDPAAAAVNRRVVIVYGPTLDSRSPTCG